MRMSIANSRALILLRWNGKYWGNDEISGNNGISNQYSTEIHVSVQRCGSDSGITAEEEEDSIFPGPPQNLHTTSVHASFATFAYEAPDDPGASQIIGYVVEYKPSSSLIGI